MGQEGGANGDTWTNVKTYPTNHAPAPPALTHQIPGACPPQPTGRLRIPTVVGAAKRLLRERTTEGKDIGANLAARERERVQRVPINGMRDLNDYSSDFRVRRGYFVRLAPLRFRSGGERKGRKKANLRIAC